MDFLVQAHYIGVDRPRISGGNYGAVGASGKKKNRDDLAADKVPLSISEIRVLLGHLVLALARSIDYVIGWSNWRRWHQTIARRLTIHQFLNSRTSWPLTQGIRV